MIECILVLSFPHYFKGEKMLNKIIGNDSVWLKWVFCGRRLIRIFTIILIINFNAGLATGKPILPKNYSGDVNSHAQKHLNIVAGKRQEVQKVKANDDGKEKVVTPGWLGVMIQKITSDLAETFGLASVVGALVGDVVSNGPAEKAGIKRGDVIVRLGNKEIKEMKILPQVISGNPPGTKVEVEVIRNGENKVFIVTLGVLPSKKDQKVAMVDLFGMEVRTITPEIAKKFKLEKTDGVLVSKVTPKSVAAKSGIREKDVIIEVNRKPVHSLVEYKRYTINLPTENPLLFLVRRGEFTVFIGLEASLIQECDRLAASPYDQESKGEGVKFKNLNAEKAIAACKKAVELNPDSSRFIYQYGRALDKGKHYAKAAEWYRKAAEQGYAAAQHSLGVMYYTGRGVAQDYKEAGRLYRKAAEQGFAVAQYNLGVMYENGQGVAQDSKEAVKYYRKAAEQGITAAQYNLGVMYKHGQGVAQDYKEAVKFYRKAAEQGDVDAQHSLGVMYQHGQGVAQDYKEAGRLYRKAVEQGYAAAQNNLGVMYQHGQGVAQDYKEAVKLYRKAAEQGATDAQYNLGVMYDNGRGVSKNFAKAVEWYRKAAEQGDAAAQDQLGFSYRDGKGVPKNYAKASEWYRKAAEQGLAGAQVNLGVMYQNGQGVAQDSKEAVKWYRKATEHGDAVAQNNLGVMYDNGWGVPKDYQEAVYWYKKSAKQGYQLAKKNLRLLESERTRGEAARARRFEPYYSPSPKKSPLEICQDFGGCGF